MEINVDVLGTRARQVISQDRLAAISGITSRGLFVSVREEGVLFLSGERYRGPLTLNLKSKNGVFEGIKPGDVVQILDGTLFFPTTGLWILARQANEWKPDKPSPTILSPSERRCRLNEAFRLVSSSVEAFSETTVDDLKQSMNMNYEMSIISSLEPLLGRGIGLTPGGDDLIIGFLLSLNRWGNLLYPNLRRNIINQSIMETARQRTTALSVSLIECAAQAQAEERLIMALDSLVTGTTELPMCIYYLRSYGNSSGIESFIGMILALTT
jgi:hypothetical protein